jgi:short-subunit dehydrogenase
MRRRLSKSAMVTGASSGIGEAYTRLLASLGYDLIIVARRDDRLISIAKELEDKYGESVTVLQGDLCSEEDLSRVEEKVRGTANLSVLINNAGFGTLGPFVDVDISKSLNMIALHVTAPTRLVKAALPAMLSRREGIIVNVASMAPFLPVSGNVIYNGTKAYLIAFSECLQLEVESAGIRVQALCPGFTRTGFHSVDEYKNVDFSSIPAFLWMQAEKVVAQSWQAVRNKKVVFIPGFINRITCTLFGGLFRYLASKKAARTPARKAQQLDDE